MKNKEKKWWNWIIFFSFYTRLEKHLRDERCCIIMYIFLRFLNQPQVLAFCWISVSTFNLHKCMKWRIDNVSRKDGVPQIRENGIIFYAHRFKNFLDRILY